MRTNKLFHVLLMSGALVGCAVDSEQKKDDSKKVAQENADAGNVADAATDSDAARVGMDLLACNGDPGDAEQHLCDFAGEESGQEACALAEEGKDLCCCWAPMTC